MVPVLSSPSIRPTPDTTPYDRLAALGLALPPVPEPIGNFANFVREGSLIFLSGQGPTYSNGDYHSGKVGADVSTEDAYAHARLTGLNLLSVLNGAVGDLSKVRRIVKILGMVNADPGFEDHPAVINGCSDLFMNVFGDEVGRHARSAVGFGSLPRQITVEIEAVVAVG